MNRSSLSRSSVVPPHLLLQCRVWWHIGVLGGNSCDEVSIKSFVPIDILLQCRVWWHVGVLGENL